MSTQFQQIRSIFLGALERPMDEWSSYLEEAAAGDADLQEQVRILLDAHADGTGLLDKAVKNQPDPTLDQPITEKPGTQIGPYKLLQQLGEGGMGVVYMAEQKEPVKRRVALKIIKPGMDTRQVIARFEAERQALAMMDHPNIAKVLDAGATESGRPYFVMELVNGVSITQYCDEQHLTPKERLELFVPICQAIQHAHQKGIIHRDLKPSNLLVAEYDHRAVPKVIDFGVAKATSQTLTEKTMFTQLGQIVGTLEYMSPEQAKRNQLDVDTRSDIYSLGVVLYELLTGETPFDRARLRSAAFDEMLRIIREEEPSKPSTKVSSSQSLPSIAANRHIEPAKLSSMIRGELDWIVLKAMEKDRGRRYETASKFAEDVQHYLNDEAVVACPPSRAYRFRKFTRRNRPIIATAGFIATCLIVGLVGTAWQAVRATRQRNRAVTAEQLAETRLSSEIKERQRAEAAEHRAQAEAERAKTAEDKAVAQALEAQQEATIAEAVSRFLQHDLLGMAKPSAQLAADWKPDLDITLRTVLNRAADNVGNNFPGQPAVEGAIQKTIGDAYTALGLYEQAQTHHRRALALINQGEQNPATLEQMESLGLALGKSGQHVEAEKLSQRIYETYQRLHPADHPKVRSARNNYANALTGVGRLAEAEELHRINLGQEIEKDGKGSSSTVNNLGVVLSRQKLHAEAQALYREAWRAQVTSQGKTNQDALLFQRNLGNTLITLGRLAEAEEVLAENWRLSQQVLGDEHPETNSSRNLLAQVHAKRGEQYKNVGETAQAIAAFRQHLTITSDSIKGWRNLLEALREFGDKERLESEIATAFKAVIDRDDIDPKSLTALRLLGQDLQEWGYPEQGLALQKKQVELRKELVDAAPGRLTSVATYCHALRLYASRVRTSEECEQMLLVAAENLDAALANVETLEAADRDVAHAYRVRGELYRLAGDLENAMKYTQQALELNPADPWTQQQLSDLLAQTAADDPQRRVQALHHAMEAFKLNPRQPRFQRDCRQRLKRLTQAVNQGELPPLPTTYALVVGHKVLGEDGAAITSWLTAENQRLALDARQREKNKSARDEATHAMQSYLDPDEKIRLPKINTLDVVAVQDRVKLLIEIAEKLKTFEDTTAAQPYLEQAIELDSKNASAYRARGDLYLGQAEFAKAMEDYAAALPLEESARSKIDLHYLQGYSLLMLNKPADAATQFERVIALFDDVGDEELTTWSRYNCWMRYAIALEQSKQAAKLEQLAQQLLSRKLETRAERVCRVWFCMEFPQFVSDWKPIVELAGEDHREHADGPFASYRYAMALISAGAHDRAEEIVQEMISRSKEEWLILLAKFHLAHALNRQEEFRPLLKQLKARMVPGDAFFVPLNLRRIKQIEALIESADGSTSPEVENRD